MTDRRLIATAAPWAATAGYSRAVRVGNVVHVSGTVAVDADGAIAHPGDPYLQARRALEIILAALAQAGAQAEHVVRTRMYVADAGTGRRSPARTVRCSVRSGRPRRW